MDFRRLLQTRGAGFVKKVENEKAWSPLSLVKAWQGIFLKAIRGFVIKFVCLHKKG